MSTFVGVVAVPMGAGTVDARPATAHDPAANYTFSPDNHAPGAEDGAVEHYAVGLEKDLTALHTIVVKSEAFDFADCSAQHTEAFGIDRGNDDPGTQTDESLVTKYKGISFQEDKIVVQFYKEDGLGQSTVGLKTNDQIVARGTNCYDNPDQKGWYQVTGKLNGSTNDNKETDYGISVKTHYIYVCDCDSRQEAVEKLGPPPSEQDGSSGDGSDGSSGDGSDGGASEPTATATPGSGSDDPTATATATPESGDDGTTTSSPTDGSTEPTATTTGTSDGGPATTSTTSTATSGSGTGDTSATATGGSNADLSTPTENSGPGFGLAAAFGALLASGALALRRRD